MNKVRLFKVPTGKKVKITSKSIRYMSDNCLKKLAEDITWEGIVTGRYYSYEGKLRRLVTNPDIKFLGNFGIWQVDCDCEIVD